MQHGCQKFRVLELTFTQDEINLAPGSRMMNWNGKEVELNSPQRHFHPLPEHVNVLNLKYFAFTFFLHWKSLVKD